MTQKKYCTVTKAISCASRGVVYPPYHAPWIHLFMQKSLKLSPFIYKGRLMQKNSQSKKNKASDMSFWWDKKDTEFWKKINSPIIRSKTCKKTMFLKEKFIKSIQICTKVIKNGKKFSEYPYIFRRIFATFSIPWGTVRRPTSSRNSYADIAQRNLIINAP